MTQSEIQQFYDAAKKRLMDAQASSMSHNGRSATNYDLDSLRKDLTYWNKQLRSANGRPMNGVAKFS